jgi:hypothetical protein
MSHPLCNIQQSIDWLIKPVGKFISRIQSSTKRPKTRSSLQDASLGLNFFLYLSYIAANEFVNNATDDVLLIDYVEDGVTKKIWHCSNLRLSDMLAQSVTSIYKERTCDNDRYTSVPYWMQYLQKATESKAEDA